MNNDYVQRFVGKDEISPVAAEIKKNIEGMAEGIDSVNKAVGKSSSTLDTAKKSVREFSDEIKATGTNTDVINKISLKFEKMQEKLTPTKQSIRQLTQMMAELNYAGATNTEVYTNIAQEVGKLRDAYADASQSAKAFADDNLAIAAAAQSIQLMTGVMASVTAGMQLFGTDSEKVAEAQKKLQIAIAAVNGAMAVANTLNKNSTLITALQGAYAKAKLKVQAQQLASEKLLNVETIKGTAATGANAAATGADTVAKTADAAATTGAAGAQMTLNTALAMGKALMGDWTVILTVAASLLGGLAISEALFSDSVEDATDDVKKQQEELENWKKQLKEVESGVIKDLYGKFIILETQWKNLKSVGEQTQFIKDNVNAFHELGVEIRSLADAQQLFINGREAFVQTIQLTAQLAVKRRQLEKALEEGVKTEEGTYTIGYLASGDISKEIADIQKEIDSIYKKYSFNRPTTGGTSTTKTTTKAATPEKQLTILQQLEAEVRKYQTMLGNIDLSMPWAADELQMVKDALKKAEQDLKDYKLKVGLEVAPPEEGSVSYFKNLIAEYDKKLNEKNLTVDARIDIESKKSEIQNQIDKITHNGEELSIKAKVEPVSGREWNLTNSYDNARNNANDIKTQYELGIIGADVARSQIAEINSEISKLNLENGTNLKPIEIDFIPTGFDKLKEGFDAVESGVNSIDGLVNSFEKLTDGLNGSANAWETFMNVMSLASSLIQTYEGLTTAIETFKKVKSVVDVADTGKKTAEAAVNKQLTKSNIELAASQIYLAHSNIPVLGAAYATSQITIMEATMKSLAALEMFYNGGVVGGSFREHPVLAHRGEVIFNSQQQKNLLDIANGRAIRTEQATRDRVIGRIRGTDIELVMKNLSKEKSRAGIEIEIR